MAVKFQYLTPTRRDRVTSLERARHSAARESRSVEPPTVVVTLMLGSTPHARTRIVRSYWQRASSSRRQDPSSD
jgi:hypothetical protein